MKLRKLNAVGFADPEMLKDKVRILTMGDDPRNNTGFGIVHRNIIRSLKESTISDNYYIASIGWFSPTHTDTRSNMSFQDGIPIENPDNIIETGSEENYGIDTFKKVLSYYNPTVLVTVGDSWMIEGIPNFKKKYNFTWIHYLPIDGIEIPARFISTIDCTDKVIVYSEFGYNVLKEAKFDMSKVSIIGHGVDTETFKKESKEKAREELGINKDDFVVLWSGRNTPRKRIDLALKAFSMFISESLTCSNCSAIYFKNHNSFESVKNNNICLCCSGSNTMKYIPKKDDVKLFLFTTTYDIGFNIRELVIKYELNGKVIIPEENSVGIGFTDKDLVDIYNSADVFLNTSESEGWGMPIHEAMSCGLPVVVPNFGGYINDLVYHMENGFAYKYDYLDRDPSGYIRCRPSCADAAKYLDLVYCANRDKEDDFISRWPIQEEGIKEILSSITKKGEESSRARTWDKFRVDMKETISKCVPENQFKDTMLSVSKHIGKKKTIAFIGERFDRTSGAEKSIYNLLIKMKSSGYNIIIYYLKKNRNSIFTNFNNYVTDDGWLEIQAIPNEKFIDSFLEEVKPELVLTQLRISGLVGELCMKHGIKYNVFMRSYEGLCENNIAISTCNHNCLSCNVFLSNLDSYEYYTKSLNGANRIIFNSNFFFSKFFNTPWSDRYFSKENKDYSISMVMYPYINTEHGSFLVSPFAMRTEEYITLIKPNVAKGSHIFLEIARILNSFHKFNIKFLLVGEADKFTLGEIKKSGINNLEIAGVGTNMADVYARSAIVLIPTICKETFGRVPIEAAANGIPVFAAALGGLVESCCESSLITHWYNTNAWMEKIRGIMYNEHEEKDKLLADQFIHLEKYKKKRDSHLNDYLSYVKKEIKDK